MGSTLWFFIQVHAAHALVIPHMHLTFRSSWGRVVGSSWVETHARGPCGLRAALFRGLTRGLLSIPLNPPKILFPPFPPLHVDGILAPFTQTWRRTARRHEGSSFARIPECQTSLLRPSGSGGGGSKSRSRETRRLAVTSRPRPPQPGRPPRTRTRRLFLLAQKLPAAVSAATSRSQSPQRRRSSSRGDV